MEEMNEVMVNEEVMPVEEDEMEILDSEEVEETEHGGLETLVIGGLMLAGVGIGVVVDKYIVPGAKKGYNWVKSKIQDAAEKSREKKANKTLDGVIKKLEPAKEEDSEKEPEGK